MPPKPKTVTYGHAYAGKVYVPRLSFGDPGVVKDLQVHLARPTGNTMQMVGMGLGRGHNPFVAGKTLSENEKLAWSLLVEHANKERLLELTFDDFKNSGLLEDTPEDRTKFDQLFAARTMAKEIFRS